MTRGVETEIKIRVGDRTSMPDRLHGAGLQISAARQFESNTLYDTKDRALKRAGMLLRLRQAGGQCKLTWKGPDEPGRHKSRPELETAAASCETLHNIFVQLGFEPSFRYEKYRTEFTAQDDSGVVMLDETPIGDFLELEGPGEWIDATAALLGFAESDYVLDSYAKLYRTDCERRGVQPDNMVFASHQR
jgi:adenylate cyclase class 2